MKRFLLVAAFILTVFLLADIFILHQNDSARPTGNTPETQGEMERENEPDGMEAANVAPGFIFPALDGGEVSLEDYRGPENSIKFLGQLVSAVPGGNARFRQILPKL